MRNQSQRLRERRPFRHGQHAIDIRVAFEDALAAGKDQYVEAGARQALPQCAHQRRRQQNVAQPPQGDDQNSRPFRQIEMGHAICYRIHRPSAPFPKFVLHRGTLWHELRKQRALASI